MKRIIILVVFCIAVWSLYAQRATDELPFGLKESFRSVALDTVVLPMPDLARFMEEDLVNDLNPGPLRYACPVWVNFTPDNSGVWQELEDGSKIWRLKVNLPGALSTNTYYDKFWIPEGGKFFVYSEDTRQSIGAFISDFIKGDREKPVEFATALIYGENVVFEYFQPVTVKEPPIIVISNINYGYRYVENPFDKRGTGTSGTCNININCPQGIDWQVEKHAVARISVNGPDGGSGWCSGALVNTTSNAKKAYVLTANHCITGLYDAETKPNASQMVFYWEFEDLGCAINSTIPASRTSQGAWVEANSTMADFALLLIDSKQDPLNIAEVYPYYLGWDRSGNSDVGGVGIHHPMGDVKKITPYSGIPLPTNYLAGLPPNSNGDHWRVTWNEGTTEGGSSGSPLINGSHRIIGQLHGGYASCITPSGADWYGKFSVSWTGNGSNINYRKLDTHLDPNNTNPQTLNGIGNVPTITGNTVCIAGSQYVLNNSPGGTIHWTVSGPFSFSQSSSVTTTTVSSPTIYVNGSYSNVGTLTARKVNSSGAVIATRSITSCPTHIVGSSVMCPSNVYYLNTLESATWSVNSSYFSVSPSTGTHVTVTASTAHGLTAQLTAVVGSTSYTFNVAACQATLSGPDKICSTSQPVYAVSNAAEVERWTTGGPFNIVSSTAYTAYVSTSATNGEGGAVIGILKNGGGAAASKNVIASCGKGGSNTGYVVAFPNPADDILYVSIDADAAQAQLPTQINVLTFDVRLYDNRGSLLQQQKTKGGLIDFNVSNLPDGIYYLHIYDGVNSKPEMQQIVVEH